MKSTMGGNPQYYKKSAS